MTIAQPKKSRRWVGVVVKIAVTAGLLALIGWKTDFSEVGEKLLLADAGWIAVALALILTQVLINGYRWKHVSTFEEPALPTARAIGIYFESLFFNQALPSVIGGDALRIFRARTIGIPIRQAATGVILDRFIGLLGLLLIAIASYPFFVSRTTDQAALIGVGGLLAAGAFGVMALFLIGGLPDGMVGFRMGIEARTFCRHARASFTRVTAGLPALIMAMTGHGLMLFAAWSLGKSVGMIVDPVDCFIVVPTALIISMAPITLAGWGLREGAMTAGFLLIGLDGSGGLAISLLIGLILLAIGLFGGLVWLVSGAGRPTIEAIDPAMDGSTMDDNDRP